MVFGRIRSRCWSRGVEGWDVLASLGCLLRTPVADDGVDEKTDKSKKDAYAEANPYCACAPSHGYEVHDQDYSPEAGLKAVHGEECSWLERIAEEKKDREDVYEQHDDDEKHEDDDRCDGRLDHVLVLVNRSQCPAIDRNDEEHYYYSHDPEGYEDSFLPKNRLLRHVGDACVVSC